MADYPEIAERLKAIVDNQLAYSSFVSADVWRYKGEELETAAEELAAGCLVGYTALADSRVCNSVLVWKTLDYWSALDADFRITLMTGNVTRALSLKIIIKVNRGKLTWSLDLFDWSMGGRAVSYTGTIERSGGTLGSLIGSYDEYTFVFDKPPPPGPQSPARQRQRQQG